MTLRSKSFLPAAILICMACISGYLIFTPSHLPGKSHGTEKISEATFSTPEQVQPGWWETRDTIYLNIPARILFAIDSNQSDPLMIVEQAWAEFDRIGKIFNPFNPDSEVAILNATRSTEPIPVSSDLFHVISLSKRLWKASNGAFDPTMLPVKEIWSKAVEKQQIPSNRTIISALSAVGFEKVHLLENSRAIKLDNERVRFDFGGIAKGYAIDRVVAVLQEKGIDAGLVQLGGEVAAFGENNEKPWRIGVQHPRKMQEIRGILSTNGPIRVSTSGNYRQPLIIAGHKFYHIFSPKTGKPVSEKILGVTTAHLTADASNALLDGAATAITVMGAEEGIALARKLDLAALILTESPDGSIFETITRDFKAVYEYDSPGD